MYFIYLYIYIVYEMNYLFMHYYRNMKDPDAQRTMLILRFDSVIILVDVVDLVGVDSVEEIEVSVVIIQALDDQIVRMKMVRLLRITKLQLKRVMDQNKIILHQEAVEDAVLSAVEIVGLLGVDLINLVYLSQMYPMNVTSLALVHSILYTMLVYAIICALQCLYIDIYFASK